MNIKRLDNLHFAIIGTALIIAVCVVLVVQSGIFDREPVVKVIADNCYDETLHVITDEDYRPYSFYDEKGNFSGHDVELIALIANKLHMNLDLKPMKWNDGIAATLAGEAQVLMTCDYSDDFAGTDAIIKSDPMSMDAFTVYSKKKISSVNDIYNERISVMANGNVTALIKNLGLTGNCTFYDSNREAMLALVNDEVDFTIMRNTIGTVLLNELGCKKIAGYMTLGQSYMCFGINGSHPELVERIDKALHEIKASGELEKLNHKWLTTFVEPYSFQETVTRNIWLILAFLTIFAIMSYALYVRGQRQAEAELRAKEHLEMANKAKTEFLFNMSHDIRTPMNAIIGFTDIARKNIDDKARVQDCLKKIEDSGAHLIDLINEVLDMSRLEAGKVKSEIRTMNIQDAARRFKDICDVTAASRDINFEVEVKDIDNMVVRADELHINQVMMNIVGNAIKYTMPGGDVKLTVTELPSDRQGYGCYEFTIRDTGVGMSKEFLSKIFETFSREETQATSGIQGTGLGMSIVKRLVDYMDGKINVESELGKGTKVTVVLYLQPAGECAEAPVATMKPEVEADLSGKKVLLVEDNELNREIATFLLQEKGLTVEEASNGIEAVDRIKEMGTGYYDCVLMDIQMPLMNGYEATKQIRTLPSSDNLIIIALSANAFEDDRKASCAAGMNDHLAKPIDPDELSRTLARYLKGE